MTTRVFLLRHAETAAPRVFHGAESDVDLSALGHLQAEAAAEALRAERLDAVVASAMLRAQKTAHAIAQACGLRVETEPDLHERRVSFMSGKPYDGGDGIWPETVRRWSAGETSFAHEGAESLDDLRARLIPVWTRITERHAGKRLAVVAHGIVIKTLLLTILPDQSWESIGSIRNVAVTELVQGKIGWEAVRIAWLPREVESLGSAGHS